MLNLPCCVEHKISKTTIHCTVDIENKNFVNWFILNLNAHYELFLSSLWHCSYMSYYCIQWVAYVFVIVTLPELYCWHMTCVLVDLSITIRIWGWSVLKYCWWNAIVKLFHAWCNCKTYKTSNCPVLVFKCSQSIDNSMSWISASSKPLGPENVSPPPLMNLF